MRLISMSVWGSSRMYWEGALINSRIYKEIYPGWTLRIYTDEQNDFTRELVANGAQVCLMRNPGGIFGMFWRFIPASDEGLDALIVRDADSRLNVREAAAVEAWLASGKGAHVMRDHPHHLNWQMLGGMWGVRGGVIPDMKEKILAWNRWENKLDDMYFLAELSGLISSITVFNMSGERHRLAENHSRRMVPVHATTLDRFTTKAMLKTFPVNNK
ncbi:hypothetical protein ABNQ39_35475 (plasmid) [Azospirillum sp. A26]|uniref:hypothetical protein n=1 Tax=Azospirillum sp. A26 TaxID=3160607 RepID=UPI003672578B